ncbi:hypothetical protein [Nitrincola schmidtii]|uniref:hypothetical protein n=1 Tax=Nitrincola schmidtii TaxID=1730894 RepID=UPI00124EFF94|nr:hypothetical protein [Nitrincola schmidtii]
MENTPVVTETPAPRFRPIWVTLLVSLIGMFATLFWLEQDNSRLAEEHALLSSGALAESASLLLTPLVINEDRISINYLLNEMASQPVIKGMRLTDSQGTILGLSGSQQGQTLNVELMKNEEPLGKLEVWADGTSLLDMLQRQQTTMAIGAGVTLVFLLFTLLIISRPKVEKPEEEEDSIDFDKVLQQVTQDDLDDSLPTLDPDDLDSLDLSPILPDIHAPKATEPQYQKPDSTYSAPLASSSHFEPYAKVKEESKPAPSSDLRTAEIKRLVAERDIPDALDDVSIHLSSRDEELDNDELVSLLRPERDTPQMPRFTPISAGSTRDLDKFDKDSWVELEEREPEPNITLPRSNPLLSALDDDEDLPNIFAFEKDLELLVPAKEAGYLLLVDTTSAHSELVEEEEHQTLLKTYFTLAQSVASIYNGRVEKASNGDLQIIFDQPQEDDTHGVNAMCAAMLFTHLYKQYNHSRIRLFRPVMNLHMALVRGKAEKLDRLLEEARFLTRTTQSNELISHTALTESPQLKESLLEGASIRREAEDKVLILQISQSYQDLLEKQSRHLMSKLNQ